MINLSSDLFSLLDTLVSEADDIKCLFRRDEADALDDIFGVLGGVLLHAQEGEVRIGDLRDLRIAAVQFRYQIEQSVVDLKELVGSTLAGNVFSQVSELARRLCALSEQELKEACESFK